ncbi:MAG TPA: TetR/AcrR family transcriptional regulator [Pseudomonadales bacterium]
MSKSVGRPRSQQADEAILAAATRMFYRHPYGEVSMEAIAQQAQVSKATLYRRWPNKPTLAVEVLVRLALAERRPFTHISYREHLTANLKALRNMLSSDYADVIVSVIAETQHDQSLRDIFCQRFLEPVKAIGDADLDEAIRRKEVIGDVDKDLLFDQMFGLFYYRLLVAHKPIRDSDITTIVDAFFTIVSTDNDH